MTSKHSIALLVTILTAGSLHAQQAPGQTQVNNSQVSQSSSQENSLTKEEAIAKCLTITNQEEVMIARYAKENASSEDVKALAGVLEKSHQKCIDELKSLPTKTAANKQTSARTSSVAANNTSPIDFLQMHQEMSDQCLKDSKEMLSKKQGAEFDACFVGMQIAKHAMMHSSLTVLQRHTSGELQKFIKDGIEQNTEHMKAATQLMDQLSDKAVAKTAKNAK